jgi:hypothetical protein
MVGKAKYPPPLVRLGLMAAVAGQLGLDVTGALEPAGLDTTGLPQAAVVTAVAAAARDDPLAGRGPFTSLLGWDGNAFAAGGTIDVLRKGLRDQHQLRVRPDIKTARQLTSAAVSAWEEVAGIADAHEREEQRAKLADRYLSAVAEGREEGTRAAGQQAPPGTATLPDDLTRLLVESIPDDWET